MRCMARGPIARRRIAAGVLCALALAGAARAEEPLARLEVRPAPGWNGLRIGMSLVQLERRLGATLGIEDARDQPVCSRYAAQADHDGYRLVLGFAAAKPSAKLESLWVQFAGAESSLSPAALEAALTKRVPDAERLEDGSPEAPRPTYLVAADPAVAVRLFPGDGLLLARRDCLD